jgi:hypothetical protein
MDVLQRRLTQELNITTDVPTTGELKTVLPEPVSSAHPSQAPAQPSQVPPQSTDLGDDDWEKEKRAMYKQIWENASDIQEKAAQIQEVLEMDNEFDEELTRAVARTKEGEEALRYAIESLEELQTKLDQERALLLNTPDDDPDRADIVAYSLECLEKIEVVLANKHLYLRCALDDIETRLDKCDESVKDTLERTRARVGTGRPWEPAPRPSPPRQPRFERPERGSSGSSKMPPHPPGPPPPEKTKPSHTVDLEEDEDMPELDPLPEDDEVDFGNNDDDDDEIPEPSGPPPPELEEETFHSAEEATKTEEDEE